LVNADSFLDVGFTALQLYKFIYRDSFCLRTVAQYTYTDSLLIFTICTYSTTWRSTDINIM